MSLRWRALDGADLSQVTAWNRELQEDEGSIPMSPADIRARLERWLAGEYDGVLFEDGHRIVGYALYRRTDPDLKGPDGIYLRQFFIARGQRRKHYGRRAFELLRNEVFPAELRIVLEAVSTNSDAHAFWRALGFRVHSVLYELGPSHAAEP